MNKFIDEYREYEGRQVLAKFLVGSHNYNTDDETSDKDWKMVVMPTFDDLYKGKQFSSNVKIDGDDYSIKDIRGFMEMLEKANIAWLETLVSSEVEIYDKDFRKLWNNINHNPDQIANNDIYRMIQSIKGQMYEKQKAIEKDLPNQESNEGYKRRMKYGFDSKQLLHIHRLATLLMLWKDSNSKNKSILRYLKFDTDLRGQMLGIKNNVLGYGKTGALLDSEEVFTFCTRNHLFVDGSKQEWLESNHFAVKYQNKTDIFEVIIPEVQEFIKAKFMGLPYLTKWEREQRYVDIASIRGYNGGL